MWLRTVLVAPLASHFGWEIWISRAPTLLTKWGQWWVKDEGTLRPCGRLGIPKPPELPWRCSYILSGQFFQWNAPPNQPLQPAIFEKMPCVSWRSWKGRTKNAATNTSNYPVSQYFSPALPAPKRSSESSLQRALRHLRVPQPWWKKWIHPAAAAASDPWNPTTNESYFVIHKLPGDIAIEKLSVVDLPLGNGDSAIIIHIFPSLSWFTRG